MEELKEICQPDKGDILYAFIILLLLLLLLVEKF